MIRDITEIRHLQQIASRQDRLQELGEMAASVAHEIRNPLGGIEGFASLLKRDLKDSPKMQEMAQYIVEGSQTLNKLVTNILNYSRPISIQLEPTLLSTLINSTLSLIQADKNYKENIIFNFTSPDNEKKISLDPQLFKLALINLLINATQAMPDGGKISITLLEKKGQAILEVSDSGEGIPPKNLEKIFSPFFTTKETGNGFGLSEVYKLVQAHGGLIEAKSQLKIGTTFTIKLPLTT